MGICCVHGLLLNPYLFSEMVWELTHTRPSFLLHFYLICLIVVCAQLKERHIPFLHSTVCDTQLLCPLLFYLADK